jgi:hypothetical protein
MRKRSNQLNQVATGESSSAHWDDLTDRHAASFHDENVIAIFHAIQNFRNSSARIDR